MAIDLRRLYWRLDAMRLGGLCVYSSVKPRSTEADVLFPASRRWPEIVGLSAQTLSHELKPHASRQI
jgi:hypothetical protein